jgi:hypothetical protein
MAIAIRVASDKEDEGSTRNISDNFFFLAKTPNKLCRCFYVPVK